MKRLFYTGVKKHRCNKNHRCKKTPPGPFGPQFLQEIIVFARFYRGFCDFGESRPGLAEAWRGTGGGLAEVWQRTPLFDEESLFPSGFIRVSCIFRGPDRASRRPGWK